VSTRLAHKRHAVKLLHAGASGGLESFQRFRREAEIAARLGHPHIVDVTDFNHLPDGGAYLVMELLEGEDLAARLAARGPLPLGAFRRIATEVCSALAAAHAAGIVHRDLKPHNIFLCRRLERDDYAKVLDFGICKVLDSVSVVTEENALVGTVLYMSPEQARGDVGDIDARTDVFALGAVLWEMLTGQIAFAAPGVTGALDNVLTLEPAPAHTLRPEVPPALSAVLARALAKRKEERQPSMQALAAELEAALAAAPPRPVAAPRRRTPLLIVLALVLAAVALAVVLASRRGSAPAAPASDVDRVCAHLRELAEKAGQQRDFASCAPQLTRALESCRNRSQVVTCLLTTTSWRERERCFESVCRKE